MTARFLFHSPEFKVEVSGGEEFVSEQMTLFRGRAGKVLSGVTGFKMTEVPAPAPAGSAAITLEKYFESSRTREGRGALQDSILLFGYYLQEQQAKPEFSIEDLNFCFDLLNIRRPKSLANTLGILKRDRRLLQGGSRRGTYSLSERGLQRAKRCAGR